MLRTSFIALYKKAWCFGPGRPVGLLHERSSSAKQLSELDYSLCLCDWIKERKQKISNKDDKQSLISRWNRRKRSRSEWAKQKKREKMKNERNEALIFYLTRRSASSSLFHFVIPALAPTFSLDELLVLEEKPKDKKSETYRPHSFPERGFTFRALAPSRLPPRYAYLRSSLLIETECPIKQCKSFLALCYCPRDDSHEMKHHLLLCLPNGDLSKSFFRAIISSKEWLILYLW